MTSTRRRRSARRKIKAHDRGENRHNKTLAYVLKKQRMGLDFSAAKSLRGRPRG